MQLSSIALRVLALAAVALGGATRATTDAWAQPRPPRADDPAPAPGDPAASDGPADDAAASRDGPADDAAASEPTPGPGAGKPTVIDFGDEEAFGPGEVVTGREADDVQFGTLLRSRYRRLLEARGRQGEEDSPPPPGPTRVRVAIAAGVTIASVSGGVPGGVSDAGPRIGGAAGVDARVRLAGGLGVDPGLWYAARGATLPEGGALHYLTLPVRLRYRVPGRGYRLDLGVGPAIGLALSSRLGGMDARRWELGAVATAGLDISAGSAAVALAVRYEHGLTDVVAASGIRNRSVAITAGYGF